MHSMFIAAVHRLLMVALPAATLGIYPAFAQLHGDTAEYVSASYAPKYARYYAPYAIQAAAAYTDVASFNATLGPSQKPSLDGSDVKLAVASLPGDAAVAAAATKYFNPGNTSSAARAILLALNQIPNACRRFARIVSPSR